MCHMCRRRSPRQTTPNVPPISAPPPHPTVTSQPQPSPVLPIFPKSFFLQMFGPWVPPATGKYSGRVPSHPWDFDRSLKHSLFRKDALDTRCRVPFETFQYKNIPLLPSATLARASPRAAAARKRRRGQQGSARASPRAAGAFSPLHLNLLKSNSDLHNP